MSGVVAPLFFLVILSSASTNAQNDLPALCGDCFCNTRGAECPVIEDGTVQFRLETKVKEAYESFQLVGGDSVSLEDANGNAGCNGVSSLGFQPLLPESLLAPCSVAAARGTPSPGCSGNSPVCAFKFLTDGDTQNSCAGREYEMITYASPECAAADGAFVSHVGACGLCSSAQDLAVSQRPDLADIAIPCATAYFIEAVLAAGTSPEPFQNLVKCTMDSAGYTLGCATVHAFSGAASAILCTAECSARGTNPAPFVAQPPECEPEPCAACANAVITEEFNDLSGWTFRGSGLLFSDVVLDCDAIYRVAHDPCAGVATMTSPPDSPILTSAGDRSKCDKLIEKAVKKYVGCLDGATKKKKTKKCTKKFGRQYGKAQVKAEKIAEETPCENVVVADDAALISSECLEGNDVDTCVDDTMSAIRSSVSA